MSLALTRCAETRVLSNIQLRNKAEDRLFRKYHRYYCQNAFSDIWFGASSTGIHGHTPTDVLHTVRLGIMACTLDLLVGFLTTTEKDHLDRSLGDLGGFVKSSRAEDFPRISFVDGITNLAKILSSECVGIMLSLLCYLLTNNGYNTFSTCLQRLYRDQHPQQGTVDMDPTLILFSTQRK